MEDRIAFARLVNVSPMGGPTRCRRWVGAPPAPAPSHAGPQTYRPLLTRDADLAFSDAARLRGDIGEALRSADFREEFSSEYTPPIAQYRLGTEGSGGFYAEFLVPLVAAAAVATEALMRRCGVPGSRRSGSGSGSDCQRGQLHRAQKHALCPQWNYTLHPRALNESWAEEGSH